VILVTLNAQGEDDAANVFQTIRQTGHRVLAEIAASRAKD